MSIIDKWMEIEAIKPASRYSLMTMMMMMIASIG